MSVACRYGGETRRARTASCSPRRRSAAPIASRAGPERAPETSSSSLARSAPRAPRSAREDCRRSRTASRRESGSRGSQPRCSTSRTVSRATPATSPSVRASGWRSSSSASRSHPVPSSRTSASARTTSCSPPPPTRRASRSSVTLTTARVSSCRWAESRTSSLAGITFAEAEPGRECALEVAPWPRADESLLRLAVREEDHGRDREHLVPRGDLRVVVDVDAGEPDAPPGLLLELLEDRPDRLAGPAPRRPEVDEHGRFRAEDGLVELACRQLAHVDPIYKRPSRARSRRTGTFQIASSTIARLIFDWPAVRSAKRIGTSTTRKPLRSVRYVVSI